MPWYPWRKRTDGVGVAYCLHLQGDEWKLLLIQSNDSVSQVNRGFHVMTSPWRIMSNVITIDNPLSTHVGIIWCMELKKHGCGITPDVISSMPNFIIYLAILELLYALGRWRNHLSQGIMGTGASLRHWISVTLVLPKMGYRNWELGLASSGVTWIPNIMKIQFSDYWIFICGRTDGRTKLTSVGASDGCDRHWEWCDFSAWVHRCISANSEISVQLRVHTKLHRNLCKKSLKKANNCELPTTSRPIPIWRPCRHLRETLKPFNLCWR